MNEPTKPPAAFNRLSELSDTDPVIGMLYSGAGKGKTWLLGTGGNRHLIIDTGDTRLVTLKSKLFKDKIGYDPIIISIDEKLGPRGVVTIATAFDAVCDTIDWAIANMRDQFDTISINDVTQLRRFAMNKGLEASAKLGKSQTKTKADALDVVIYAVQDYGMEMDLVEKFVSGTKSICMKNGLNFFMAAHERLTMQAAKTASGQPVVGEAPVVVDTRPGFTGKTFPDNICMYFDLIWHLESVGSGDNIVYRARTQGGEDITARTNFGGIFSSIVKNPHLLKTIELIKLARTNPLTTLVNDMSNTGARYEIRS